MKVIEKINIPVKKLSHAISDPVYATEGAVGMDLSAAISRPIFIKPLERFLCPTGYIFEVPEGYEAQVRARSGLAIKRGLSLINGVGTIDSDYRGEVLVPMVNLGTRTLSINPGERIAQVVISPVAKVDLGVVLDVSETERSSGGFGSTGVNTL